MSTISRAPVPPDAPPTLPDALVATLETVIPHYHRVMRRSIALVEGEERLLFPQLRCLQVLARTEGPAYAAQLARALLVTPPTMTRTIDALVERGLVARQPEPASRRQIALVITPEGLALVDRYEAVIAAHLHTLIAPLPADRQERLLLALQDLGALLHEDTGPDEDA
ncbi:MAG: winged helix-turn-helix transcriptional regulator [Thermomicrobiales bacterium]|nr:winged helix-turn-helix transcriptional regulator [Thermomicrobiales bacterium]